MNLPLHRLDHRAPMVDASQCCPGCHGGQISSLGRQRLDGSEEFFTLGLLAPGDVLGYCQCEDCGLVFTNPRYADATLAEYYGRVCPLNEPLRRPADFASNPVYTRRITHRFGLVHAALALRLKPGAVVADFGGNDGASLVPFVEAGFRTVLIDPGSRNRTLRSDKIEPFDSAAEVRAAGLQCDAVLNLQTLEHILDVRAFVAEMLSTLKPGGLLYCEVPYERNILTPLALGNRELTNHCHPEHINYFSLESLRRVLALQGVTALRQSVEFVPVVYNVMPSVVLIGQRAQAPTTLDHLPQVARERLRRELNRVRLPLWVKSRLRMRALHTAGLWPKG